MNNYKYSKDQQRAYAQKEADDLWQKYLEVKSKYGDTNPALINMWHERYCKAKDNLDKLQNETLPNIQPNKQISNTYIEYGLFNNVWTLVIGIVCSILISAWILNGESSWGRGICILFITGLIANVGRNVKNEFEETLMLIALIGGASIIISFIYGIWYWICGGFFVVGGDWLPITITDSFWERALDMVLSLIPLGFIIGLIAILFGWNPGK